MKLYVSPTGSNQNSGSLDAPLLTLQEAINRIKVQENGYWDGGVEIILREGRYPIEKPVEISMHLPLTIRAYKGERPVIDGARVIEGLKEETVRGLRCFTANLPQVGKGEWFFRSLFANGKRCTRAYLPRNDFYWIEATRDTEKTLSGGLMDGEYSFFTREGDMKAFKNLQDVEMHVFHFWIDEHMPVVSFDPKTREVVSSRRSMFVLNDDYTHKLAKYRIEHIFEGLCEPGDFYLDREDGKLYYLPYADETIENTVLSAPVTEQFLYVHDASDVRIEGIAFEHADWSVPERLGRTFEHHDDGTKYAASPQAASNVPGALHFIHARRCAVVNCEISHVGGYGVCMEYDCASMQVSYNRLNDLGAGGVFLNGAHAGGVFSDGLVLPPNPVEEQSHHVLITDNEICFGGRVFLSGIGVASLHAHHVTIAHNYIHDLYYTGVSCGWIWGYVESASHDNIIEYNHIHTLGHGILSDMGGIYTLSVQPGTVIRYNLIHDIEKSNYGGWAIYPDEGSSHILIENNVCYDTSSSCFHQHYGRENIVRNNIWAFGREGMIAYTRKEPHIGFTFERNIVLTKGQPIYEGGGVGNIRADMNLFWDVDGKPLTCAADIHGEVSVAPLETLREKGYDLFSIIEDPKFVDAQHGDFTLLPDSPAKKIGFVPIDLSGVGPRPYTEE